MNPDVDHYLAEGCGRCAFYATPHCKVHSWTEELLQLRRIVLECGLQEEFKWSQPCYTYKGKNVVMVSALKDYAILSFLKGSLLKDPYHLLMAPGKNSQANRQFRFTQVQGILDMELVIKAYIDEATDIEKAGRSVAFSKETPDLPEELLKKFEEFPQLRTAFEALTPGRQRGYLLHFNQAKQSSTRSARIERCINRILQGKGLQDR